MKRTVNLVTIALMAAILCILAPMYIPLGFSPIPLTLGTFLVAMIGIVLGAKNGASCVFIYLLLGMIGLPVFSGYMGGFQKLFGPSGGFLWGYFPIVICSGLFTERSKGKWYWILTGTFIGILLCYFFGGCYMMLQMNIGFYEMLIIGIIPFLPLDIVKMILATFLCGPIRKQLIKERLMNT